MESKDAKKEMLKSLSKEMRGMMGEGRGDTLKKVTVASDSEEGLEKGLSKAQEIMKAKGLIPDEMTSEDEMEDEMEDDMEDMPEEHDEEMESDEFYGMEKEDLIKMLRELKK